MAYGYVTPTGGFTIELWFNHANVPTWPEMLISQQTRNVVSWDAQPAVNGRQLGVYLTATGALEVDWRNEAGTQLALWTDDSTDYAHDGNWHFLAIRLADDQQTWSLFLNADLQTTSVLSTPVAWSPGALSFGGAYAAHLGNFGDYLYNGGLAYVAVWDKALTTNRINEHYTAGSGGTVFYGDDEVTRLGRLYDYCGVPTNARRYEAALTTLQGIQIAGENGLDHVMQTGDDAGGLVFADGQAVMTYHNRRHRYNRPVLATLSERTASAPDVGMEFTTDDTKIYNDVRASRPYGGSARLRNLPSENEYGRRIRELKISVTSDDEVRNAGTWIVERYGEDRVRVSGVTLSAATSEGIQRLAESVSIGDKIAFDALPENAPERYMEFIVEGISLDANFKEGTWSIGFQLSPADLWNVFQVGVSTLGDGSRIAY